MDKNVLKNNINEYLNEEKFDEKSENTLKRYKTVIKKFVQSMPEEITKADLMTYKKRCLQKYKPSTVKNVITIINKFIKYCELTSNDNDFDFQKLKRFYSKNLLKQIKTQEESSLENVLEPVDLKRLLRTAKKYEMMDMYYIMKILAYTGIRISEMAYFTVESVKKNNIQVSNKGKIRKIILRSDLRREVLHYCKNEGIQDGQIFRLSRSTLYNRLNWIAGKSRGINKDKVHPHAFRHLFAIQYLKQTGNLTELADILGHNSIETTRIYTRTSEKMKKQEIEKLKY